MCAISGFFLPKPIKDPYFLQNLAKALLFYGETRGAHSTGAFVVGTDTELYKRAVPASEFTNSKEFLRMFKKDTRIALLHNRFPTSGGREDQHAHPFTVGQTTSIHNGTFFWEDHAKKKFDLKNPTGVDSELISEFVDKYGIAKFPDLLDETSGQAAVAIYTKGKLYLARHSNPLYQLSVTINEKFDCYLFASTFGMLENAIKYASLIREPRAESVDENKIFSLNRHGWVDTNLRIKASTYATMETGTGKYTRSDRGWNGYDEYPAKSYRRELPELTTYHRDEPPDDAKTTEIEAHLKSETLSRLQNEERKEREEQTGERTPETNPSPGPTSKS